MRLLAGNRPGGASQKQSAETVLRRVFVFAIEGVLSLHVRNPFGRRSRVYSSASSAIGKPLAVAEARRLLEVTYQMDKFICLAIILEEVGGLAVSEVRGLRRDCLDLPHRQIRILSADGKSEVRTLNPATVDLLLLFKPGESHNLIFRVSRHDYVLRMRRAFLAAATKLPGKETMHRNLLKKVYQCGMNGQDTALGMASSDWAGALINLTRARVFEPLPPQCDAQELG